MSNLKHKILKAAEVIQEHNVRGKSQIIENKIEVYMDPHEEAKIGTLSLISLSELGIELKKGQPAIHDGMILNVSSVFEESSGIDLYALCIIAASQQVIMLQYNQWEAAIKYLNQEVPYFTYNCEHGNLVACITKIEEMKDKAVAWWNEKLTAYEQRLLKEKHKIDEITTNHVMEIWRKEFCHQF